MKKFRVVAVVRSYYTVDIDANNKEHAELILSQMKNFDLNFQKSDAVDILVNSLHQINNENEKPTNI